MHRRAALLTVGTAAIALLAGTAIAPANPFLPRAAADDWAQVGRTTASSLTADEGVATVASASGTTSVLYRGVASIPLSVLVQGWVHIGDPDSRGGYVIDAYQGSSGATSKMFRLTTPARTSYQYVHKLVSGEEYNNSFDAISPDGQWLVAGEWDTMTHLQIYPTPRLNPATSATGGTLALAGYITLDHAVNDVQGCDFVTATELICASDDTSTALWPDIQPLLRI